MSNERRAECYRLLSSVFCEPDRDLFREERVPERLADAVEAAAPAAARRLREAQPSEDILVDYARLFVGPQGVSAPPYGSVYLEPGRRVMGDSTMAVAQVYADAGLEVDAAEPADHIALELEFAQHLVAQPAELRSFLETFVQPWVPEFAAAIRDHADGDFYPAVADCLEGFIASECDGGPDA